MHTFLMTTRQAAAALGLACSTLEKARVFGTGPKYLKLGRAVRYRECDIHDWLKVRVHASTSEDLSS